MFEKIKQKWQRRIEKNAFKSTLEYIDRDGKVNTEEVYFKRSLMPLGDWQRIYPPLKNNGRKISWLNFTIGGWRNFIKLLIVCGIVALILFQFSVDFTTIENLRESCIPIINPLQ